MHLFDHGKMKVYVEHDTLRLSAVLLMLHSLPTQLWDEIVCGFSANELSNISYKLFVLLIVSHFQFYTDHKYKYVMHVNCELQNNNRKLVRFTVKTYR